MNAPYRQDPAWKRLHAEYLAIGIIGDHLRADEVLAARVHAINALADIERRYERSAAGGNR